MLMWWVWFWVLCGVLMWRSLCLWWWWIVVRVMDGSVGFCFVNFLI